LIAAFSVSEEFVLFFC